MRVRCTVTIAAVLCGSAAWAQSENDAHRVFQLSNSNSQKASEIAYAVRSLLAPRTVADGRGKSITVSTAPVDLAMAEWLIDALDRPTQTQDLRVDLYPGSTGGAHLAIFRLARTEPAQVFSELVNASRTVPEITDVVFPIFQANAIVVRADQDKLDKAEWILRQLELPAAAGRPEAKYQTKGPRDLEMSVFYTREALPTPAFQEILNALRTIPPLMKVFPVTGRGAVAVAGPAEEMAVGEWLFQQLDRPTPDPSLGSPSHDAPSGDAVQVFFMPASLTEDGLHNAVNRLRGVTRPFRVFPCSATRAIVVRGTPAELSQAKEIVRDAARQ